MESVEDCFLDGTDRPVHSPTAIIKLIRITLTWFYVSETIVFECEANDLDVTVVQVEVISTILR